ncbi:hypothetical protein VTI74DRAFT_940 [Chaetomium olivicolor]
MLLPTTSLEPVGTIYWSDTVWNGDPDGDMTLEYEGHTWLVKGDIASAHFPHLLLRCRTTTPILPAVFSALLGYLHTNEFPRHLYEPVPSFLTYTQIYFLAERFDIHALKTATVQHIDDLSRHVLTLSKPHCSHCPFFAVGASCPDQQDEENAAWEQEERHLNSFVHAVICVEEHRWSAKIQKAVYDAGERLRERLVGLPAFCEFTKLFPGGMGFARAIGVGRV